MVALPAAFGQLVTFRLAFEFPWQSAAAGLATGLLTTLLFCLPPLLDVRAVRPVLVLRRLVEQGPTGIAGWIDRWWARRLQLGIAALVIFALGAIAWALSDSAKVGAMLRSGVHDLAAGSAGAGCSRAFRAPRFAQSHAPALPSSLRHGLANLYRPGNQSAAVLAALGTGVMLILSVYLMQKGLLRDLHETAAPSLPNVFLIDVRTDEVAGVKEFFAHQPGVSQQLNLIPVVMGRFISINGQPVEEMKGQHYPRRMLESAELSWADSPPEGDKVTEGAWWTKPACAGSRGERYGREAAASGRWVGGGTGDRREHAHSQSCRDLPLRRPAPRRARVSSFLPSGQIADEPSTWYGGAHIDPKQVAAMERAFFRPIPQSRSSTSPMCSSALRASSIRSRLWSGCWPGSRFSPG